MKTRCLVFMWAMLLLVLCSSCATIVSGGDPCITIKSDIKESVTIVTTKETYQNIVLPAVVKVSRHKLDGQRITITSDNYKFNDIVLSKAVNEWAFGNILIGGLVGWGIDLCTNAVVKPSQHEFYIQAFPKEEIKNEEGTR